MGLFDSIFGGSESKQSSQSGFALLPKELQNAFKQYGSQLGGLFSGNQSGAFTPLQQTEDETAAFNQIRQGLAPTQQSFSNDISMFMNPYDDYVVNDINRQAQGQNSLVNQAATQAGQQGSNRSFLATSDVEQNRLNNIGQFRQNQYNTAVNNVLGPLAQLRQQDISNLLGIGGFQRDLNTQTQQAPFNALQMYGNLLGAIPQSGGSTSTGKSSSTNGILGGIGSLFG